VARRTSAAGAAAAGAAAAGAAAAAAAVAIGASAITTREGVDTRTASRTQLKARGAVRVAIRTTVAVIGVGGLTGRGRGSRAEVKDGAEVEVHWVL